MVTMIQDTLIAIILGVIASQTNGHSTKRGVGLVPDTWSDPNNPSFLCGDMEALGKLQPSPL